MSVHASVWVNCPDCDSMVEFQTHIGPEAAGYDLNEVPPEILFDIQDDWNRCGACGMNVGIKILHKPYGIATMSPEDKLFKYGVCVDPSGIVITTPDFLIGNLTKGE